MADLKLISPVPWSPPVCSVGALCSRGMTAMRTNQPWPDVRVARGSLRTRA